MAATFDQVDFQGALVDRAGLADLALVEADEVGALYRALGVFRKFRINMTKIETRPSKRKAWEYFFFVDCDGHMNDKKVAKAIQQLEDHCNFVKVLGSFPKSD